MTISNAVELGLFIGQLVASIVKTATEAFQRGETITVDQINESTQEAFDSWNAAKARRLRKIEGISDAEGGDDAEDQPR